MPLRRVVQTSRIIIFEQFTNDEEAPNLATFLSNKDIESDRDGFSKLVEEELEVKSFQDFMAKFTPAIWEWMEPDPDSNGERPLPCFSLEKPKGRHATKRRLDKSEFYEMVMQLYEAKSKGGDANINFNYDIVGELLSPERLITKNKKTRRDLKFLDKEYNKLKLAHASKSEINAVANKILAHREEIKEQTVNNFPGILRLSLADTKARLNDLALEEKQKSNKPQGGDIKALPLYQSYLDDKGEPRIKPIEAEPADSSELMVAGQNELAVKEENAQAAPARTLATCLASDYKKNETGFQSEYVKNLVISTFTDDDKIAPLNLDELKDRYDVLMGIYKKYQENFIKAISDAVEKILDVKVFFDQALRKGARNLPYSAIIANCKAGDLLESDVIDKFKYYMDMMGNAPSKERLWFGLLPNVDSGRKELADENTDAEEIKPYADDVDPYADETENESAAPKTDTVSMDQAKRLLDIMRDCRIMTFFNLHANEATGFRTLSVSKVQLYREIVEKFGSNEYAVFCYPNFSLIPLKESCVKIGEDRTGKAILLDLPGIYVDASYVAAGLMVGIQNPEYLLDKGFAMLSNYPCVRFDIEGSSQRRSGICYNRDSLLTTMNCEDKMKWPSSLEEEIAKDGFGFCFCGNERFVGNDRLKNTYVLFARSLDKDETQYKPLYSTLTTDFIHQFIGNTVDPDEYDEFFRKNVSQWVRDSDNEKQYDNQILRKGENISKIGDGEIEVDLKGGRSRTKVRLTQKKK